MHYLRTLLMTWKTGFCLIKPLKGRSVQASSGGSPVGLERSETIRSKIQHRLPLAPGTARRDDSGARQRHRQRLRDRRPKVSGGSAFRIWINERVPSGRMRASSAMTYISPSSDNFVLCTNSGCRIFPFQTIQPCWSPSRTSFRFSVCLLPNRSKAWRTKA
jgi:hypothetical protein